MSTLLLEHHTVGCTCTYCDKTESCAPFSFGLWLPQCKARNSWRVIWWNTRYTKHYLRWTLPNWAGQLCTDKHRCTPCMDAVLQSI